METTLNNKINGTDLTITECQALYWDDTALQIQPVQLRRLDSRGMRKYFTVIDNKVDKLYTSVTSFVGAVLPKGEGLIQWMKNLTPEQQEDILRRSSAYGTLMDILNNTIVRDGKIDNVYAEVNAYLMKERMYDINAEKWEWQIKRDLLAFIQFLKDYEVKPIATSVALIFEKFKLAGTVDFICEMNDKIRTKTDIKKGIEPNRIKAVIDYKAKIGDMQGNSERNSFYESEALQLLLYKYMVESNLGIVIDHVFNWSPKNWRTAPDYNLKCWSNSVVWDRIRGKVENYYENFKIDHPEEPLMIQVISDCITLDGENLKVSDRVDLINETLAQQSLQLSDVLAQSPEVLFEKEYLNSPLQPPPVQTADSEPTTEDDELSDPPF